MTDNEHAVHPSPRQYVQIAVALAVITAIEVALFYLDESLGMGGWDAPLLVLLSFLTIFLYVIVLGSFGIAAAT